MAIKITLESFLAVLRRSNLIDAEQIKRLTDEFRAAQGEPPDAKPFADFLVQQKQITAWQAEKLLMGKHKGFFLGRYKLKGLLGKGGMSSVYLAEHVLMRRMCALKVLPARRVNDASYLGRFHREAQAVAALDHPNIVRAYDVDHEEDGEFQIHFLVMEYVEGKSLLDLVIEKGLASPIDAADYVRQAALGLEHAHRAGIIHRDIKPGNLLLDNGGTIKLLDMGLARFFGGDDEKSLTIQHDEKVLGTADYLAPEQAVDSHKVDRRADIYSLGCSLYFLLTGHPPFNAGTLAQRLMAHQMKEPPDVSATRADVPASLVAIMKKMMAKLPDQRYATAGEAADALTAWLETQGVPVQGVSDSGRMRKVEEGTGVGAKSASPPDSNAAAPPAAPVPTPRPAPRTPSAPPSHVASEPEGNEGFAALGDLFGEMSQSPAAPAAPSAPAPVSVEPRTSTPSGPPSPAAPVDDDVPAFLRGGADTQPEGFPNFFDAPAAAAPPAAAAAAPRAATPPRPVTKNPPSGPAKGAPAKAAPAKGSQKPPASPAPSAAGGDDVPDFLRMGGNSPAQAEPFANPFAEAAASPPAAPSTPAPKKSAPVASPNPPAAKAPPKAKPAPAPPPRAPSAPPPAVASAPAAQNDLPDFLQGGAEAGANGDSSGSSGFADLFSSEPPATSPDPAPTPVAAPKGPARPAARAPGAKPTPRPAPSPPAVPTPAADDVPAFLTGRAEQAAPIGDIFSTGFQDPSPAPSAPAGPAVASAPQAVPPPPPPTATDDVPEFLNLGAAAPADDAGGMPDLFGATVAMPQAVSPPPPPAAPKAPAVKAPARPAAKATPVPAAEPEVPDFLSGGGSSSPLGGDGGFPDFLGAASSPPSPPPAPAKAPPKAAAPKPAPPKASPTTTPVAAPAKSPSAPAATSNDVPDFLAGSAVTSATPGMTEDLFGITSAEPSTPPAAAVPKPAPVVAVRAPNATLPAAPAPSPPPPPPTPQENVPAFLVDGPSSDAPSGGGEDLFGIGAADPAPEPLTASPLTPSPLDASTDSPFDETVMALPADDATDSVAAVPDNPFGDSNDIAAPATSAPQVHAGATKKAGGNDVAAAALAWLKVRRNQMIAGAVAAAVLTVGLAVAFWPKGKTSPAGPGTAGAPTVAASIPSAAAVKSAVPRPKPQGATYTVGPNGNFGTVTEAVNYFVKNAPIDGARRTIMVTGGYWYSESIAVSGIGLSSPLTITSDAASPAVLRPVGGRPILNLPLANGLVLENLQFDANGAQGCAQIEALGADSRLTNVEFRNFREFGLLTEAVSAEDATKPIIIENCRFLGGAAGAKGILVKTSTSTVFGLTVRQSQFQAPMRTGIEFGAGALGNVTVSQCRFVDIKMGLYFPPTKQDVADLLLLNNTFYRAQEGIVFNQAPSGNPQGMKSALIGNLFVVPAPTGGPETPQGATTEGADVVIRAGLTTQTWDAFTKGGPGIAGNMTERGGSVGAREVDVFTTGGGRRGVTDLAFESVIPGTPDFLKPTSAVSFPPPKVGEPYAGAVAP